LFIESILLNFHYSKQHIGFCKYTICSEIFVKNENNFSHFFLLVGTWMVNLMVILDKKNLAELLLSDEKFW